MFCFSNVSHVIILQRTLSSYSVYMYGMAQAEKWGNTPETFFPIKIGKTKHASLKGLLNKCKFRKKMPTYPSPMPKLTLTTWGKMLF